MLNLLMKANQVVNARQEPTGSTMRRLASHNRRRTQRGAAAVEGALILLTLLSMIMFIMDMGRMLLFQQFYLERARDAARNASVNSWTDDAVKNYVCYGSTTATAGTTAGLLGCRTSNVTVTTMGTAGVDQRIQVKVSGVQIFAWIPFMAGSYTAAPVMATMPMHSQGN